jgi:hypothetical protein
MPLTNQGLHFLQPDDLATVYAATWGTFHERRHDLIEAMRSNKKTPSCSTGPAEMISGLLEKRFDDKLI